MKQEELSRYEAVCRYCTKQSCQQFIDDYGNMASKDAVIAKHVADVRNRQSELTLWDETQATGTIAAYQDYLQSSKYKSFAAEADAAITKLTAQERWRTIKDTASVATILAYQSEFPQAPDMQETQLRLHELRGEAFYRGGQLLEAYQEFNEAGGRTALRSANLNAYDACREEYDYRSLTDTTSENALIAFLSSYPQSTYYSDVSNRIAIVKARNLTLYSTEEAYRAALSYATDDNTQSMVESYISRSRAAYQAEMRRQRRQRIKYNGGYVLFGIELMDMGFDVIESNRLFDVFYYDLGISFKVGNYRAPVQFEVGIKPGFVAYQLSDGDYFDENSEYDTKYDFHLPAFARLKINLFNAGSHCKFYLSALGFYNVVRRKAYESEFAVGGGCGFAWRHGDIQIYYKQDINGDYVTNFYERIKNNKYIAISYAHYF